MTSGAGIGVMNFTDKEGGEREYLNDAELAQMRVDARKQVDSICGPQG